MTKLGTPIGAGPKGAIIVVGLPRVGAPPGSNWAPPSLPSPSGWVPPPVALGAVVPPPLPPPLESPRLSLWVTPPRVSASGSSSIDSPWSNSLWPGVFDFDAPDSDSLASFAFEVDPDPEVEVEGELFADGGATLIVTSAASLLSLGELQSGSSMSISPSPSLSMPSEHWGAGVVVVDGVVVVPGVVVVGVVEVPAADEPVEPLDPSPPLAVTPGSRLSVTDLRGEAAGALPTAASARKAASANISASLLLMRLWSRSSEGRFHGSFPLPTGLSPRYPQVRSWATVIRAPNMALTIVHFMPRAGDFHVSRMRSLSCRQRTEKIGFGVSPDEYADGDGMADGDSLRARSEQAIGEIAQALIDSPHLHSALQAAFGAREKAIEAQQAAMSALNLPSASDVERLERRIRSFSQRLEDVEEQLDDLTREIGGLRRKIAAKEAKAESEAAPESDAA